MKLYLPKETGFCNGVSAALNKAYQTECGAYCLGQIVHNKSVTDALLARGIVTVDDISRVPDGATLIIRAHGAPKSVYDEAERRKLNIVDATCPSVRAIQRKAAK